MFNILQIYYPPYSFQYKDNEICYFFLDMNGVQYSRVIFLKMKSTVYIWVALEHITSQFSWPNARTSYLEPICLHAYLK
jgi:hypothetical protein